MGLFPQNEAEVIEKTNEFNKRVAMCGDEGTDRDAFRQQRWRPRSQLEMATSTASEMKVATSWLRGMWGAYEVSINKCQGLATGVDCSNGRVEFRRRGKRRRERRQRVVGEIAH